MTQPSPSHCPSAGIANNTFDFSPLLQPNKTQVTPHYSSSPRPFLIFLPLSLGPLRQDWCSSTPLVLLTSIFILTSTAPCSLFQTQTHMNQQDRLLNLESA